jgi:hypothetical protein
MAELANTSTVHPRWVQTSASTKLFSDSVCMGFQLKYLGVNS